MLLAIDMGREMANPNNKDFMDIIIDLVSPFMIYMLNEPDPKEFITRTRIIVCLSLLPFSV